VDDAVEQAVVGEELGGLRLDRALAELFPHYSRSRLKQWVLQGQVRLGGAVTTLPRQKVQVGESLELQPLLEPVLESRPEAIALEILFEDEHLLVVNKPAGLVVHPGAGNPAGTLMNALLYHTPTSELLPRAGIVHRLDKETSGLLVVGRTLVACSALSEQLAAREIRREYDAVVLGALVAGGVCDAPIGRHRVDRKRMAVVVNGRPAVSHYRVAEKFRHHSHLRVRLETGRTHQIRVHMSHLGHALVGDPVYGARRRYGKGLNENLRNLLEQFRRQALHARLLALTHPITGEPLELEAPLPDDMEALLAALRADSAEQ